MHGLTLYIETNYAMSQHIDRYAVMGNPISHSKSPQIHAQFAKQTHQEMNYEALLVEIGGLAAAVDDFQAAGGKGLNITVPFKQDAWDLVTERTERAELAGAVNTIVIREDGSRYADTTDGVGMVRDIVENNGLELKGKCILVLGAGGAVRGVLQPLLEQRPQFVIVANRTESKAVELAKQFNFLGDVFGCGLDALPGQQFDLVINGTAASLEGEVPPLPDDLIYDGGSCYDMMYSSDETVFQKWACERGAVKALDGLGMLVEQAAESFSLWRGVRPETAEVIASLRAKG